MSNNVASNAGFTFIDYVAWKKAGTATIVKLNGMPHCTVRRYDPITGTPSPQMLPVPEKVLQDQKASLEADLAALNEMLVDVQNSQEVIPQS